MGYRLVPVLVFFVLVGLSPAKTPYDPMVAFVCNKGAMHMDPDMGWHSDSRTDCLENKDHILDYCESVYPSLDVTNIVEASDRMTIKGWCPVGQTVCTEKETFKVRPHRCLTGAFQSDALMVPERCEFEHVHESNTCREYAYWADVSRDSCRDLHQGMQALSFAMLLPCGTDLFTGVEFVCCPKDVVEEENDDLDATTVSNPNIGVPKVDVKVSAPSEQPLLGGDGRHMNPSGDLDVVSRYLSLPVDGDYDNEHDVFELARSQLTDVHQNKITKLMTDWAEARDRVTKLKDVNPQAAETQNAEITDRYQKEYFAMQSELDSKLLQLDAVHQQHVQANLNYKKRIIMQKLMAELRAEYYDVENILELLKKYITVEEKDAHHCMKHFVKIRSRDAAAAQDMLPATIEHLTLINTRINQSIDLVDTVEDEHVVEKLKTSVRAWIAASYVSLDTTIEQFRSLRAPIRTEETTMRPAPPLPPVVEVKEERRPSVDGRQTYKAYADRLRKTDFVRRPSLTVDISDELEEEDEPENEHDPRPKPNNMQAQGINAEVQGLVDNKKSISAVSSMSAGATVAIASGVIAAMMVVVLSILIVKKRSRRSQRLNNHYLEVAVDAPEMTPEDRHIAAMQSGYENPTYKLLESRKPY